MAAWKAKYSYDGYLFPFDPFVWEMLLSGKGSYPFYSVPFYTLHKIMQGLLDQYQYAGNLQAFDLLKKMAEWTHNRVEDTIAKGGMSLWQQVLLVEWGGMNDVFFNLFQHTRDPIHLFTGYHSASIRSFYFYGTLVHRPRQTVRLALSTRQLSLT